MSPRFLILTTFGFVGLTLLGIGLVGTWGVRELFVFLGSASPSLQYNTSIRNPSPPPPSLDRSKEGPDFGTLVQGPGQPSPSLAGSWSQFRGDNLLGIASNSPKLARSFPKAGPKVLWNLELGEGYAGAAVRNGKVFVLDYDSKNRQDVLRCFSFDDAREIWRFSYPVMIKRNHGMSRTVPAVSDKYCVSISPMCYVSCVDPTTGKLLWSINMVKQYGTVVPNWYAGQCPILTEFPGEKASDPSRNVAIIAPSGTEALMVAIDCATGKEIWRTPNPFGWTMTHTSISPMQIGDRKTFVYVGKGGIVGVDAQDGKVLWSNFDWNIGIATCPSPVVLPDNRIFLCGGYESPSAFLQIEKKPDNSFTCRLTASVKNNVFGSEQQTPLYYENHLFGLRQLDRKYVCLNLDGKVVWHSGSKGRFGSRGAGPYLIADGLAFILSDEGVLTIAEATVQEFKPIGSFEIFPEGHDAWGPMCFVEGRLILRDFTHMICLDVREQAEAKSP